MRHLSIQSRGLMTIALDECGQLFMQDGRSANFNPLAPPPCPLGIFSIAPAGLVGSSTNSSESSSWILPINVATNNPSDTWECLNISRCKEMVANEYIWAGLDEADRVYTGCFNRQNPTQISPMDPIANPSRLAANNYGVFIASDGVTFLSSSTGAMGQYGPWTKCTP